MNQVTTTVFTHKFLSVPLPYPNRRLSHFRSFQLINMLTPVFPPQLLPGHICGAYPCFSFPILPSVILPSGFPLANILLPGIPPPIRYPIPCYGRRLAALAVPAAVMAVVAVMQAVVDVMAAALAVLVVCVILYFYPATCGPKGHGSGSAAVYCNGGSCFYIPYSLAPGPA